MLLLNVNNVYKNCLKYFVSPFLNKYKHFIHIFYVFSILVIKILELVINK